MQLHANHRTCPKSRLLICRRVLEGGWTLQQAAEAAGCSVRTATKWVSRLRAGDPSWDLLDGGVNDNTGIPALWEAVEHLNELAHTDGHHRQG